MTLMKKNGLLHGIYEHIIGFGRLIPVALISAFLPMAGFAVLAVFALPMGEWLRTNWEIGSLLFAAGIVIFCGLAILPPNLVGVVSGWSFGFGLGTSVLMAGLIVAALVSFAVNARIAGDRLTERFEQYPRFNLVYKELLRSRFWHVMLIVTLLRMSFSPFALTNFLLSSARVSIGSFLIGTAVGMFPRSAGLVFLGSGLSELSVEGGREPVSLVIAMAATVISIIAIAYISRRALGRMTGENTPPTVVL